MQSAVKAALKAPAMPVVDPERHNGARGLLRVSGWSYPEAELEPNEFEAEVPGVPFHPVGGLELYLIFKLLRSMSGTPSLPLCVTAWAACDCRLLVLVTSTDICSGSPWRRY